MSTNDCGVKILARTTETRQKSPDYISSPLLPYVREKKMSGSPAEPKKAYTCHMKETYLLDYNYMRSQDFVVVLLSGILNFYPFPWSCPYLGFHIVM